MYENAQLEPVEGDTTVDNNQISRVAGAVAAAHNKIINGYEDTLRPQRGSAGLKPTVILNALNNAAAVLIAKTLRLSEGLLTYFYGYRVNYG